MRRGGTRGGPAARALTARSGPSKGRRPVPGRSAHGGRGARHAPPGAARAPMSGAAGTRPRPCGPPGPSGIPGPARPALPGGRLVGLPAGRLPGLPPLPEWAPRPPGPSWSRSGRSAMTHLDRASPALPVTRVLDRDAQRGQLVAQSVRRGEVARCARLDARLEQRRDRRVEVVDRFGIGQDRPAPGRGRGASRARGPRRRWTSSDARSAGSGRGRGRTPRPDRPTR